MLSALFLKTVCTSLLKTGLLSGRREESIIGRPLPCYDSQSFNKDKGHLFYMGFGGVEGLLLVVRLLRVVFANLEVWSE